MRLTVVHNQGAGDEEHSREWLEGLLADAEHEMTYVSSEDPGWPAALAGPAELVVAAGGDGTVCEVFTGLAGTGLPATVLPLGSANNIARSLGIPLDEPARLVGAWEGGSRRPYDIGRLRSSLGDGAFVEAVGGGVFGDVLLRAESADGDPGGEDKRQQGFELLRGAIADARPQPWGLTLDGEDLSGEFLAVEAMNIGEIGPNLPLAPAADPGDGAMDLVFAGAEHREVLAAMVEARAAGRAAPAAQLPSRRGRRLEIRFPAGCCLHLDDELWPEPERRRDGARLEVVLGVERIEVVVPH